MCLGPLLPSTTGFGEEVLCVGLEDGRVDVDGVWVEELWVLEWGEEWFREALREEGVFVGSLEAAHAGVDMLGFTEDVGEEGGGVVGGGELKEAAFAWGQVHAGVVGELDSLNDVEDDGVFEAAVGRGGERRGRSVGVHGCELALGPGGREEGGGIGV